MTESSESQYDMGYTPREFSKVLNGGFTNQKSEFSCQLLKPDNWQVTHKNNPMQVIINITKKPDRVLGAIALPVLLVIFKINSATAEQSDFFFDKFFKYFHKGGG